MLSELNYQIVNINHEEDKKEVTFSFFYQGREVEITRNVLHDIPGKIELMEELIFDAQFGKQSYEDFLKNISIIADMDFSKYMYDYCVDVNSKLRYLLGDYEQVWYDNFNEEIEVLSKIIK